MAKERIKTAVVGCGAISRAYIKSLQEKFHVIELVGCADKLPQNAQAVAGEFGLPVLTVLEILDRQDIQIVLNLTPPMAHFGVTSELLKAGKHVYTEKAVAVTMEEALALGALAREKGVLFTAAPDTFLGGGWQTARKLVDDGYLGTPLSVTGVCVRPYQLMWETTALPFVFQPGGGMPFDMGVYYLQNMINLFGGIRRVAGFMRTNTPTKRFLHPRHPEYGQELAIQSPNMMASSLEFESGVYGSLVTISEADMFPEPQFVVHGTQGVLTLFDPNDFSGPLLLQRTSHAGHPLQNSPVAEVPFTHGYLDDCRGLGVADMAYALLNGRAPRADAALGIHALEALLGTQQADETNATYVMQTTCARPAPLRPGVYGGTAQECMLDD